MVSPYNASIRPTYFPNIAFNEVVKISFNSNLVAVGATVPDAFFILRIQLQTATGFYSIDNNKEWEFGGSSYYFEPYDVDTTLTELNLTLPPAPESGTIYFEYVLAKMLHLIGNQQ